MIWCSALLLGLRHPDQIASAHKSLYAFRHDIYSFPTQIFPSTEKLSDYGYTYTLLS